MILWFVEYFFKWIIFSGLIVYVIIDYKCNIILCGEN